MSQPAFAKLMVLAKRRLDIAQADLARAEEQAFAAANAVVSAVEAHDTIVSEMARCREDALDRFVGTPTRRAGVSDILVILKEQDDAVGTAKSAIYEAEAAKEAADQKVVEMAAKLKQAQAVKMRREEAFIPLQTAVKAKQEQRNEAEGEEEFGYARRL